MTLLEVVVSVAVLALLLGILLPTLMGARAKATELKCLTHLRSISGLVQSYAADNSDSPPSWITRGISYESTPAKWREYASQASATFKNDKWLDYAGLEPDSETQHCPANSARSDVEQPVATSDFYISSSFYIRPAYLEPTLPASVWYTQLGARSSKLNSVRFPSDKVSVFEYYVWHGWPGRHCDGCEVGGLEFHNTDRRGSVLFADGHGGLRTAAEAVTPVNRYPIWPSHIYDTTPRGIHGRDFN
jgi:type II secretory pathway pseudopilin PulG